MYGTFYCGLRNIERNDVTKSKLKDKLNKINSEYERKTFERLLLFGDTKRKSQTKDEQNWFDKNKKVIEDWFEKN